jgi:hypothetical protein
MRRPEVARPWPVGAGKGPALVPEQQRLRQGLRNGVALHVDERALAASAGLV